MVTEHISPNVEKNAYYSNFAAAARTILCIVVEEMAPAYFLKVDEGDAGSGILGLCLLLRSSRDENDKKTPSAEKSIRTKRSRSHSGDLTIDNIYAVVPLRAVPELESATKDVASFNGIKCRKIKFICIWDMFPHIFGPSSNSCGTSARKASSSNFIEGSGTIRKEVLKALNRIGYEEDGDAESTLVDGYDCLQLWHCFTRDIGMHKLLVQKSEEAIASSIRFQATIYNHPKPLPTFQSRAATWEQLCLEGPQHIMASRSFVSVPPIPPLVPERDYVSLLQRPKVRLIAIPKDDMRVHGDLEKVLSPLVDAILEKTGNVKEQRKKYTDKLLMPIHAFQVHVIREKIKEVEILPEENHVTGYALMSMRTLAFPDILDGYTVKFAVGIESTCKLNGIEPMAAAFGTAFSKAVSRLSYDRDILTIQPEVASAYHRDPDENVAKHCAIIVRESIEFKKNPDPEDDDLFVVAGALVEKIQKPDTDEIVLTRVWKLDTEQKRKKFLDRYIKLALEAFIPPCRDNGFSFQPHMQNVIARFDRKTGELKGFLVRDIADLEGHNETIKETVGIDFKDLSKHGYDAAPLTEGPYPLLYFSLFYLHFQPLIRRLNLHHNGFGWQQVRTHFSKLVPKEHPMYHYFMEQEKVPSTTVIASLLQLDFRIGVRLPAPNLILTRPQTI